MILRHDQLLWSIDQRLGALIAIFRALFVWLPCIKRIPEHPVELPRIELEWLDDLVIAGQIEHEEFEEVMDEAREEAGRKSNPHGIQVGF